MPGVPDSTAPRRPPRWVWAVYVALFAASVPWYLPAGPLRIWFGLPHWVVVSLTAIAGVAAFTLFVVSRYWPDDDEVELSGLPHDRSRR